MLFPGCVVGDGLKTGTAPAIERILDTVVLSQPPLTCVNSAGLDTEIGTKLQFLISIRDCISEMINHTQPADTDSACVDSLPRNIDASSSLDFRSLKSKIIGAIDALDDVNLEISSLHLSHDSQSTTLSSLIQTQLSLDADTARLRSGLEAAKSRNRDLSFRLNHVLKPSLNELYLEKQSMDEIAKNQLTVMQIEERELAVLRSQLDDRRAVIESLEEDINKAGSKIGKSLPREVLYSIDQSNDPLQNDLNMCLEKVECAYSEAITKNRRLGNEVERLQHAIWLKTETRLKPTLDRIVSLEVEHQRLVLEQEVIDKTNTGLMTAGEKLLSKLNSLEVERVAISEKTRIANNQLKKLTLEKSNLEESYRNITKAQTDSQKSLGEDQEKLRKVTCERNEGLQSIEKHVNQMKQNIVEISSLKEKREKIGEIRNVARKDFESVSKRNQELEEALKNLAGQIGSEQSTVSDCESLVRFKKTEIAKFEDSIRRERIELNEFRRKLDISKIAIAKFRGIGSRLADAKSQLDQLVTQRREKESRLIEIVDFNKTKPNANISEIFVLTTDSINERIAKTETRLVKSCERLNELQFEFDNINLRKMEIEEKTRNNILFMQKVSKLKIICMHIDRQVIAREAEIIVYTAKRDELRKELSETQQETVSETPLKRPPQKNHVMKPQQTEPEKSDDWIGVIVR